MMSSQKVYSLLLYADDVLFYHPIQCLDDHTQLQQDKLLTWTEQAFYFSFTLQNVSTLSYPKRYPLLPSTELNTNGTTLVKVDHYNYLEVWLSHSLSQSKQAE